MAGSSDRVRAARRAVEEWEYRNAGEPEAGPWITGREVSLRIGPQRLQYEMDGLRGRVGRLSLPAEFPS